MANGPQVQPFTPAPSQATAPAKVQEESGTLEMLRRVCARFHLVARQLRLRKEYRPTLEINDEYDLQDLGRALRLQFDEVGTDDWSPPYANGTQRTSYLLDWGRQWWSSNKPRSGLSSRIWPSRLQRTKSLRGSTGCRHPGVLHLRSGGPRWEPTWAGSRFDHRRATVSSRSPRSRRNNGPAPLIQRRVC